MKLSVPAAVGRCVLAAAAGLVSAASAAADTRHAGLLAALEAARESGLDASAAAERLAAVHDAPIAAFFELYAARGVPAAWREGEAEGGFERLDDGVLDAVALAMGIRGDELALFLRVSIGPETDPLRRERAIRLLGRVGRASDLELLVTLASPPPESTSVPLGTRTAFAGAIGAYVGRQAAAPGDLGAVVRRAPLPLCGVAVRALGDLGTRDAVVELAGLLRRRGGLDMLILASIARAAPGMEPPCDPAVAIEVRRFLSSSDVELAHQAIVTAGKLEDDDAVPELIALLDAEPLLSRAALGALRELVGVDLGESSRTWDAWYEEESRWWSEHAELQFAALEHGTPTEARHALGEISRARLYRHEVAEGVAAALARQEPELVVAVCNTLQRLGSPLVLADLVPCLGRDEPVRTAAWNALRSISGTELPAEQAVWERWLEDPESVSASGSSKALPARPVGGS